MNLKSEKIFVILVSWFVVLLVFFFVFFLFFYHPGFLERINFFEQKIFTGPNGRIL